MKQGLFIISVFMLLGFLQVNSAHALKFTISNAAYPGAGAGMQAQLDALSGAIEDSFNTIASNTTMDGFLNSLSNANAGSTRSFLAPGVIAPKDIYVAFVGSAALATRPGASGSDSAPKTNSIPPVGVSAKTGVTVGLSGKLLHAPLPYGVDPSRFMFTASFFSLDMSRFVKNGITLKSMQGSVGGTYLLRPMQNWLPMVRWNGFRLSSGLTYTTFNVNYQTPFTMTQTSGSTSLVWNSDVDIGADSWALTVPLEATTGIRLLWFLNLYTGLGLDFNVGGSKTTGGGSGPIVGTDSGSTVYTATGTVDGADQAGPTAVQLRYLIGLQFDLGPMGVFAQTQLSTPNVRAINLGVNFTF